LFQERSKKQARELQARSKHQHQHQHYYIILQHKTTQNNTTNTNNYINFNININNIQTKPNQTIQNENRTISLAELLLPHIVEPIIFNTCIYTTTPTPTTSSST
jgi:hypothetical protein